MSLMKMSCPFMGERSQTIMTFLANVCFAFSLDAENARSDLAFISNNTASVLWGDFPHDAKKHLLSNVGHVSV